MISIHLVVVGGGSAGHVLPALPVIERFLNSGHRVTYVGTRSGMEARLVEHLPLRFKGIAAGKLRRYFSFQNFVDVFKIGWAVLEAFGLLLRDRPNVVFSKGGFVSFPVVFAAWVLRIPVVAHESDITAGLANRLAAPFIRTLCVSFADTHVDRDRTRVVHTGTPIRNEILNGRLERGRALLELAPEDRLIIVTGGSLGAEALNAVLIEALPRLADRFVVLHVCGVGKVPEFSHPSYRAVEYIGDGWGDMLVAAELVVSRAGANALFELLALGKLNLLVPLSAEASRGDQIDNARFAAERGLSAVIDEDGLDADRLVAAIDALIENAGAYQVALAAFETPDAPRLIAEEIMAVSGISRL